jgi:hypothetical protein
MDILFGALNSLVANCGPAERTESKRYAREAAH